MPKLGANDMPLRNLYYEQLEAESVETNEHAFQRGLEEGYRAGWNDALRHIKDALYKLYGNSMKTPKEKKNGV